MPSSTPPGRPYRQDVKPPARSNGLLARAETLRAELVRLGPGAALLPLRAFLGVTFLFAGLQKIANPNFFDHSSPISIWSQLVGAERTSPIAPLLGHLLRVATPLGVLISLGEVAIGLGILLGLLTRVAALGGMALSLGLFLTVSFHSNPYYTGADIVFFFALSPLVLAGAGEVLALDPLVQRRALALSQAGAPCQAGSKAGATGADAAGPKAVQLARRQVLARAVAATSALALVGVGLDALLGRLAGGAGSHAGTTPELGRSASSPTSTTSTRNATGAGPTTSALPSSAPSSHPAGSAVGPARDVPVGGAAMFQDPATGDPAIVVQAPAGHFVAFDAVCPHAGCTVGYSATNSLIVCPCHGSEFDPSTGARVAGPAPHGLRRIQIAESSNGELYAV